jgi:multidrug efflux pump subunit AcrA (membrane-fusion protein)
VRTAGSIDTTSRTLLTELEVENPNNEILPGSYAQVTFGNFRQDPTLVLPANTLLFRAEGTQVGVVDSKGHVELRNILIGRDFGRTFEILSGVTATDQVIFNPADSLVSGATVRIAAATPEAKDK